MSRLHGRVVVVTGATAGIGRATVRALVQRGATVVGCARTPERLDALRAEMPQVRAVRCDVTDPTDRELLVGETLERHRRIDVLVNNAGLGWVGRVADMTAEDVQRLVSTNVVAPVELTRLVLPGMLARGDGDVVFLSSVAAWASAPPLTLYSATKHAVEGFASGLRREVVRDGVRVHLVNPGPVATEFISRAGGYEPAEHDPQAPAAPGVAPELVAAAVIRLLERGRSGSATVPRVAGLTRLLAVPPLRSLADAVVAMGADRLVGVGRAMVAQRTAGRLPRR